jgi:hypothetical protein
MNDRGAVSESHVLNGLDRLPKPGLGRSFTHVGKVVDVVVGNVDALEVIALASPDKLIVMRPAGTVHYSTYASSEHFVNTFFAHQRSGEDDVLGDPAKFPETGIKLSGVGAAVRAAMIRRNLPYVLAARAGEADWGSTAR